MRRPSGAMMRSMIEAQLAFVGEALGRALDNAAALDVNVARAVDHDFGDVGIAHEILERAEPQRFVDDLLPQAGDVFGRVRRSRAR